MPVTRHGLPAIRHGLPVTRQGLPVTRHGLPVTRQDLPDLVVAAHDLSFPWSQNRLYTKHKAVKGQGADL